MTSVTIRMHPRRQRSGLVLLCLGLWLSGLNAAPALAAPSIAVAARGPSFILRSAATNTDVPTGKSNFLFQVLQGASRTETVTVTNIGDKAGAVLLYVADGTTSSTGGIAFQNTTAPKTDVGEWLTLDTTQLTLAPGHSQNVGVTLTVPADASAGQHEGGIVAQNLTTQTSANQGSYTVTVVHDFVMPVLVNLPGTLLERLEITSVTAGGAYGYQALFVGLRNSGTQILSGTGTLVLSQQGAVLQRLSFSFKTLLPRVAIQYPLNVQNKALGVGDYSADVTVNYGNGLIEQQTINFSITDQSVSKVFPPGPLNGPASAPSLVLLIGGGVAVVLVLILLILLVSKRRRASQSLSTAQDRFARQKLQEYHERSRSSLINEPKSSLWDKTDSGTEA